MSAGLLDIAIVPHDAPPIANYRKSSLVREPMVLVGRAQERLKASDAINLSKLDGLPLVLPGRPNVARIQVERELERKGMQFRLAVETDTLSLCLDLARRGIAFTVVPASSLHGQQPDRTISWAPVKGLFVTWAFCENVDRMHSQAVREGRKLFLREVSDVVIAENWLGAERVKGGAV
jgi:LysR family nitrogen assimilation transcriptional regulator